MIYLQQGSLNNQALVTCSRNKSLTGAVTYLWTVRHKLSQQTARFIPYREPSLAVGYEPSKDLFYVSIDDSLPEVLIGSPGNNVNIHLIPGEWYLKIYEQYSTTNLLPSQSYDVVYEGMLIVETDSPIGTLNYTGTTESVIIYQN
jgi:hypothetical protein